MAIIPRSRHNPKILGVDARSPIRDPLSEGFSHFVTSMTAPVASGWSGRRVGLAPTGERRLFTAHTPNGHSMSRPRHIFIGYFCSHVENVVEVDQPNRRGIDVDEPR